MTQTPMAMDTQAEVEAEEDENITHMAVVSQEVEAGLPRVKISAQSMNQRIFSILLSIPGVDAQPDTLDKGPYGPWFYLMEEYAAEQLALYNITTPQVYHEGDRTIKFRIESRKILDDVNNRRNATGTSSAASLPLQLIESSLLHIIVRVYSPAEVLLIRLKYLAYSMGETLEFIKGNQQKNKVRDASSNLLVTIKSKAPIWHLYFAPKVGHHIFGMSFPAYLRILTPKGNYLNLKYIIRPHPDLMDQNRMVICEGPSGCKKYHLEWSPEQKLPRCICNRNKVEETSLNRAAAKAARKTAGALAKANNTTTLHAMLGVVTAGPCPRFTAGLCPNNKKGESCSGDHNIPGAWVDTPDGKRACTIACKLPPHSKIPGICRNGKSCAYSHSKYAAHAPQALPPQATPEYSPIFDSTLGYPGEGPAKIATYNINGAKEKLFHVLGAASRAKIDVLLLQETHYYASTRFHVSGVQSTAKRAGWTALHAPATATDPKGGVAILVRTDSQLVSIVGGSPVLRGLNGRLIGVECTIDEERTYIYSLYLPARPGKRLETLLKIEQQGLIKQNSIVGGDFNCVDHLYRDTLSAAGIYANSHYKKWREAAAKRGLVDIYPFLMNDTPGGFTHLTETIHTRIDRIYGPTENTSWRWVAAVADPTLFTGKSSSDHLPVVVAIEALSARPPTKAEAKIKPDTLQLPSVRAAIHQIWTSVYKRYPPAEHGQAEVWTLAKKTIATFVLDYQRQQGQEIHPVQEIKNLIKIAYSEADSQAPSQARIDSIKALETKLHKTINSQRKSATAAANKAAQAESQSKQFYKKYRPSLKNGGIASLHTTPNWEDPETKGEPSDKIEDMCYEAARYYKWLFQERPSLEPEALLEKLKEKRLSDPDKSKLDQPIHKHECIMALRSMADGKSPGPDKLPAEFYKQYESLILNDYFNMITEACEYGYLPDNTTEGTIALLYKHKGDPRDMRNYRPITLLQNDYKIFAKILVARLKKKITNIISPAQLGFVPGRVITEATHLLKLIQAYLDENEQEGLIIALDWEKAFDRASWDYYHQALEALNFGPRFITLATMLSNPYSPPKRRVRVNGTLSEEFTIHCGVPQGCPFSPLAFLIIAEGLTRLIEADPEIEGVMIDDTEIKISQFADDTQIILRNYKSIAKIWPKLNIYERATNMRGNKTKFVGIQCGSLIDTVIPDDTPAEIKWLTKGDFAKILGVPFWTYDDEEKWWEEKYLQIKTKMANWHSLAGLSVHGRVMLANATIYSIPRYWMQSSVPPDMFIEGLEADVYHLLWSKDHEFDIESIGSTTKHRPYIKHTAAYNKRKWNHSTGLGVGLLDLRNHAKALRVKWALRYLDASDGPWKLLLDKWLARSIYGRANILSNVPTERLIGPINRSADTHSRLPEFWKAAITEFRDLELKRRRTSHLGAESQPLWRNALADVQPNPKFKKVWKALGTHMVAHLTNEHHERFTREENEEALECYKCDTITGTVVIKGERYVTAEVLDSFNDLCDAVPQEWLLPPLSSDHLDRPCEGAWWGQREALVLLQKKL